ncbi:putative inactive carboxylesterase 4 isoform X2 [Leguminivora glycinivorella]|uniref:putative inactive carboxylesterase 4 isoform X2 n=1 Tax=Leguminivora glycinivorella TaxID=1035111 RepID=UPI00200E5AE2|nr:putative inactive carboxylesterase 4 isoform X2 [Leguminivora glycinivorella]
MYQCIYVFLTVIASVYSQPLVDTTHGKVAGKVLRTLLKDVEYYAFMGIPYAARPVHTFRFMAPQPIQTWDGILNATKYKEPCYQFKHVVKTELPFSYFGAEDCLYLNIFTPATDENNRPIIVFLENSRFRNPTPEGDTVLDLKWPPYTETKEYLHINKQLEVRNSINSRFRFWARFIGKWRAALRGTVANKDEL